ncbi:hypothetical protein CYLTODRAFT_444573 [Cylindrobasidium torrendii FP15055 ss-10]|uniref:Uncharacterized protein n=1 Tax=Cylindrobasidium torrendii FP15055 ss-10 TaxID=1314674 RepID=A0A0D7B8N9_9AGAR|nr:hypothetical protein CYLTODRAFT_444573 [Cylindrobasidium torrendii FP15055 ss-10]
MNVAHTEDCISYDADFDDTTSYELFAKPRMVADLESLCGFKKGEVEEMLSGEDNKLSMQMSAAQMYGRRAFLFRPPDDALGSLLKLYKRNSEAPRSSGHPQTLRLDEEELSRRISSFSLEMNPGVQSPLFTKHPVTGEVTIHEYPYPHLPTFEMRSAHPVLVSLKSYRQLLFWNIEDLSSDMLYKVGRVVYRWVPPNVPQSPSLRRPLGSSRPRRAPPSSYIPPPPVLSGKRKREAANDHSMLAPSKRARLGTPVSRRHVPSEYDAPVTRSKTMTQSSPTRDEPSSALFNSSPVAGRTRYGRAAKDKAVEAMESVIRKSRV